MWDEKYYSTKSFINTFFPSLAYKSFLVYLNLRRGNFDYNHYNVHQFNVHCLIP